MAQPAMQPLLGRAGSSKKGPSALAVLEAVAMIALVLAGFYLGVHELQPVIHVHPALVMLFPLFGTTGLALLLPPILFLSFRSEFAALHLAYPPHYIFLVRRLLHALSSNKQLKVSAKEL